MEGFHVDSGVRAFQVTPPRRGFDVSFQTMHSVNGKPDTEEDVREQVTQFIAGTFFQMMLKAMRKTVPKDGLISGGRGEEVFRDYMDQELSQRMASASNFSLVDAAVRQLTSPIDTARGLRVYRQEMPRRFGEPEMAARLNVPATGMPRMVVSQGERR